jgi:hypothetical protein
VLLLYLQARMLVQEASQMADWYLQQQQELDEAAAAAAGGGSSSSQHGGCAAVAPRGVATIIAGDFNATPHSPMYTFLSKGCIDLHKVSGKPFQQEFTLECMSIFACSLAPIVVRCAGKPFQQEFLHEFLIHLFACISSCQVSWQALLPSVAGYKVFTTISKCISGCGGVQICYDRHCSYL